MARPNNIIEINGKKYDARSGLPLSGQAKVSQIKPSPKQQSVDGIRPVTSQKSHQEPQQPKTNKQPLATRHAAPKAKTTPRKSQTLHRRSVKHPNVSGETPDKAHEEQTTNKNTEKPSVFAKTDTKRAERAQSISRSAAIERFHTAKMTTHSVSNEVKPPTKPKKHNADQTSAVVSHNIHTSAQRAVQSHKKSQTKPPRKFMRYATTAAVVLLLGGYVAYLNVPGISMKLAAHRAGFAATMPATPSGYRLNGAIAHSPGQVVVNFKSNTDTRRFSLRQQPTSWDSLALLENYVTKQSSDHMTYQDRGRTIYVYNGSDAAWVNDNKMFVLDGKHAQLDIAQLLDVAASM